MTSSQHRWILGGGLASGKSQVRRLLEGHGFHSIDADRVGHEVLRSDGAAFDEVVGRWPQVLEDGEVNRGALAAIVFNEARELTALEAITHPHIFGTINAWVEEVDTPVVVEVPVLGHSLGPEWRRIVIDSRVDIRLQRAIDRGMAEHDARARLASQPSRKEWLAAADVVIPNHGGLEELETSVWLWAATLPV